MMEQITLNPVDRVEIITLDENLVDQTAPGGGVVERLRPRAGDTIVSTLLAEERRNPFVGGHGLSMLVRVTRQASRAPSSSMLAAVRMDWRITSTVWS